MSTHLTDSELLAFCGLVRLLVRLDGQITDEERLAIAQIGPTMAVPATSLDAAYRENQRPADDGVERFWSMMDRASADFVDGESVRQAALGVTRQEARQDIYVALYELAVSDTISQSEWPLLEWLSSEWGVRC